MPSIKHVFVLMLENRSFDHMLGFSEISGADAATGLPTKINGLTGSEINIFNGVSYPALPNAPPRMAVDPYHEFPDVLEQLCGAGANYPPGGPYPPINNSGFVSNYVNAAKAPAANAGEVMHGFAPANLPVLNALAKEFAVCDSWFCSLPGPTWPNRFFALGGSSADLDHSPTTLESALWQTVDGFRFQRRSIFDLHERHLFDLLDRKLNWRIYAGNKIFTLAHALKGIHIWDIQRYSRFANDVSNSKYAAEFTWIEPNYGHVTSDYLGGNSQHPLDGIIGGEALIKATYEAIRNSPLWESSLFIITWDEHGGFYDHVAPPPAIPPGDRAQFSGANKFGFNFAEYGPRVPAVVISPLVPRNLIDHRPYDHTSVPATIERLFGFKPLTARDAGARDILSLASLASPRTDTPASVRIRAELVAAHRAIPLDSLEIPAPDAVRPDERVEADRNLPGFIYVASRADGELTPPGVAAEAHYARVRDRVGAISTRAHARDYFEEVRGRVLDADREQPK